MLLEGDFNMPMNQFLSYLAFWSFIGATLFSIFVVFVFRSGIVYAARKEDGTLKVKVPWRGYIVMIAFLLAIVGFFVMANYLSLSRLHVSINFWSLLLLNFALYFVLFLYDTLVIDGFVLAYWRPGFLHLSDQMGRESMKKHIVMSIPVGLIFGVILSGLSALISCLMLLR